MFVRVVIVVAIAALVWAVLARGSDAGGPERRYTVRQGDTLWSIAAARYSGDPREAVWRVERLNRLRGATIVPGEQLVLP
jgi:nucleoid-associated protein YgaU